MSTKRSLSEISNEIKSDWKKINYAAHLLNLLLQNQYLLPFELFLYVAVVYSLLTFLVLKVEVYN